MRATTVWTATLAALCVAAFASPATAGDDVFFSDDDGQVLNLDDLYDGETRTVGEGEHQITLTRQGNEVRISGLTKNRVPELVCRIGTDDCRVITKSDGGRTMVMVRRGASCGEGEDCRTIDLKMIGTRLHADPDGHFTWTEAETCADGEDCHAVQVIVESLGAARLSGEGPGVFHLRLAPDKPTLRCPEGDTTMRVEPDEADQVFLCPKHSVPLEKVEAKRRLLKRLEPDGREY